MLVSDLKKVLGVLPDDLPVLIEVVEGEVGCHLDLIEAKLKVLVCEEASFQIGGFVGPALVVGRAWPLI